MLVSKWHGVIGNEENVCVHECVIPYLFVLQIYANYCIWSIKKPHHSISSIWVITVYKVVVKTSQWQMWLAYLHQQHGDPCFNPRLVTRVWEWKNGCCSTLPCNWLANCPCSRDESIKCIHVCYRCCLHRVYLPKLISIRYFFFLPSAGRRVPLLMRQCPC